MRWGIISDIHGNLEALDAVLAALAKERIERYLCLGDIVGYGANPRECIARVKELTTFTIAGNHDWASIGLLDTAYFNPYAKAAVVWTNSNISDKDKQYLKRLDLIYRENDLTTVHASLLRPESFEYILEIESAQKTFELLQTRCCFIGHSHVPAVFIEQAGSYDFTFAEEIQLDLQSKYIINAGSVGQPRDGDPRACYVVYDSKENTVQIKRATYDIQSAKDKIIQARLPRILAKRLSAGR